MNAVIINEGVPGYEGTLFNGIKFYVHPQIPSRSWRVDRLKANGAKVVLLEKHADILIGDPSFPKRAPPNAVSFKYIDDCIKEGKLCDIKSPEYQIHAPPSGRPGVPSAGAKGTRIPFTDADDKVLVRWVIQCEKKGESVKGNKIYDLLAEAYPNHTSQSWRNRWVKNFNDLPRSNVEKYLEGDDIPPPPAPRRADPPSSTPAVSRPNPGVSRPKVEQKAPKMRIPFTAEDDRILLEHVEQRVKGGKSALGNVIYQELEEEHPHHSFHSWLARYKYLLQRRDSAQERQATSARQSVDLTADDSRSRSRPSASNSAAPQDRRSSHRQSVASESAQRRQTTSARQSIGLAAEGAGRRPSASSSVPPRDGRSSHRISLASDRSNIITKDKLAPAQRLEAVKAARNLQRLWRGHKVRRDLRPKEPSPRYVTPDTPEPIEMWEAAKTPTDGVSAPAEQLPPRSFKVKDETEEADQLPEQSEIEEDEKYFYADLETFRKLTGVKSRCKTVDISLGKDKMVMPLWNLWSAATNQHSDHSSRDWKDIATALEISWKNFPAVTAQLKSAFEESLLPLEESLSRYADASDESDETSDSAHESRDDIPVPVPSSPPPVTGSKRTRIQISETAEEEPSGDARKRRRYNDEDEIPYSPELTRSAPVEAPDRFSSPQQLPLLPKVTPRGSTVLESIEDDLRQPTPTRQQKSDPRIDHPTTVEDYSSSDAFDPLDESRPGPSAPRRPSPKVTEPRRRTLPKSWAKPAQPIPPGQSTSPAMLPPQRPAQKKAPPSRQPPPSTPSVQNTKTPQVETPNIDHFISLGYDEDTVMEALEATTNDVGLAGQVMESIRDGRGIPTNVAGVWTSRDDKTLDLCHKDASQKLPEGDGDKQSEVILGRARIVKKHGLSRCRARAKYLDKMPWS